MLLLLCGVLAMTFASPALAKPYRGRSPYQILTDKDLPQFVHDRAQAIVVSEFGIGALPESLLYLGVSLPGDVKNFDQNAKEIAKKFAHGEYTLGAGCSSIMPTDPDITKKRQRVNDRLNTDYAFLRAVQLSQQLDYMVRPVTEIIEGFPPLEAGSIQSGQGVLLIRVIPPPMGEMPTKHDTTVVVHNDTTVVIKKLPSVWVRLTAGAGAYWIGPQHIMTPMGGIVAGTHFKKYVIGVYGNGGQNFQPTNGGTGAIGAQFGYEIGPSLRIGYRATWTEFRGRGDSSARSEGVEFGLGYGFPAVKIGAAVSMQMYADLDHPNGLYTPAATVSLDFGPLFAK